MKKIILALGLIALLAMVPFPVSAQNEQLPPDPTLSGILPVSSWENAS